EILKALQAVVQLDPKHPLANHLYIHACEASPHPEKADAAGDRLRDLQPALGHMVHMPSHIDVRPGRWQAAIEANDPATPADRNYAKTVPEQGISRTYMAHNHHMLTFAAMMQGESKFLTRVRCQEPTPRRNHLCPGYSRTGKTRHSGKCSQAGSHSWRVPGCVYSHFCSFLDECS